jgi:hypothetical protein
MRFALLSEEHLPPFQNGDHPTEHHHDTRIQIPEEGNVYASHEVGFF